VRRTGEAVRFSVPSPSSDDAAIAERALAERALAERALAVLRDVSQACLAAERVETALRYALERLTPVVGAAFSSVFVRDGAAGTSATRSGEGEELIVAASYNWPERWRPWLPTMRVKMGDGPSGEAAAERRVIEVADITADPSLTHWHEVADELGLRALIALPLASGARTLGAVTFYFGEAGGFSTATRNLLCAAADQMASAVRAAELAEHGRRSAAALVRATADAERQTVAALEAARSRDEFLANVSHELKTPLTVVLGTIDLLSEELGGPLTDAQREDLLLARTQSERLLALVETLLALSALRRGALPLALDEFDPRAPLREALARAGEPRQGVELTCEEPTTFLPQMRGDREKTVRILVSLIDNAFKFTEAGRVALAVEVVAGRVRYDVADTGIGIPESARAEVFDEFRQVDGSATRRYGGTGLGGSPACSVVMFRCCRSRGQARASGSNSPSRSQWRRTATLPTAGAMHHQRGRTMQEARTSLDATAVLAAARDFFSRQSGVYAAFVERESAGHVVLRGQGGEEIVVAAQPDDGVTSVTASTYLFDAQVARFLSSLPPAPAPRVAQ
jgi:signal transduction histidine kinase